MSVRTRRLLAASGSLALALTAGCSPSGNDSTNAQSQQAAIRPTVAAPSTPDSAAQSVLPSQQRETFLTSAWHGERFPDGRPRVPDDVLNRLRNISLEQAWGVLQDLGYQNQFAGNFQMLHADASQPMVGRTLTAQYMPSSPDLERRLTDAGHQAGQQGGMNTWPIKMLQNGDVYVADGFGKIADGTLIGGNLGEDIYANSRNGVVFNGSVRDADELSRIEGFNAFVRGWHPSSIEQMMLTGINTPTRIGQATVLPGDAVMANREGVLFIPAHLAERVVRESEVSLLQDQFSKQRINEGTYTSGQVDKDWNEVSPEIKRDFRDWLEQNKEDLPVPAQRVQEIINNS